MTDAGPDAPSGLPAVLRRIADAVGVEAALALADARGGRRIHVPKHMLAAHWIVREIGMERARRLAAVFGGEQIDLPASRTGATKAARRRCDHALAQGASLDEAARVSGLTRSTVQWRRKHKLRVARGPQGDLFD